MPETGLRSKQRINSELCTDDIAVVAYSREKLEEKVQLWQRAVADNILRLKKTKFISSEQCTGLDCQGEAIENMEAFRYLGSDLSEEGSVDQNGKCSLERLERVHGNPTRP
ncbi:unnamed protein product [Heligmosomoides polygyrus]|uniref:Reverse transcriptase domain-containing protein n=1 Tax=Heligmosomoides polygyrus TaxID=6339 RepID=A0A183G9C5_HELPZ|nr:unnamed protein product [Heligmosomoides polygyrus]